MDFFKWDRNNKDKEWVKCGSRTFAEKNAARNNIVLSNRGGKMRLYAQRTHSGTGRITAYDVSTKKGNTKLTPWATYTRKKGSLIWPWSARYGSTLYYEEDEQLTWLRTVCDVFLGKLGYRTDPVEWECCSCCCGTGLHGGDAENPCP